MFSQDGRSQSLLLVQPLRLPQFEDFAVVEGVDFVLEELQGRRLTGQRPGDLLSHHLHHLESSHITETVVEGPARDTETIEGAK